jgi:hypothetical protein
VATFLLGLGASVGTSPRSTSASRGTTTSSGVRAGTGASSGRIVSVQPAPSHQRSDAGSSGSV